MLCNSFAIVGTLSKTPKTIISVTTYNFACHSYIHSLTHTHTHFTGIQNACRKKTFPWNGWWMFSFLSLFGVCCDFSAIFSDCFYTMWCDFSKWFKHYEYSTWNLCCRPKFRIHSQAFIQNKRDFLRKILHNSICMYTLTHTHRFLTITDSCYHRFAMPCMNSQSNNTIAYKFDWRRVKKNTISTHSTIRFECCCGMWYLSTELFWS